MKNGYIGTYTNIWILQVKRVKKSNYAHKLVSR